MNYKSLFACMLLAGMTGLGACTDNDFLEEINDGKPHEEVVEQVDGLLSIVDAQGNPVTEFSDKFGEYYLKVETEGTWELQTENAFLAPSVTKGEGPQLVRLFIGCNWGDARPGKISLIVRAASTRSGEAVTRQSELNVKQSATINLEQVAALLSSNTGTGYSYLPNTNYCKGVHMQIFNINKLKELESTYNASLYKEVIHQESVQEVITADSEENLSNKLSAKGSIGLNLGAFGLDVSGAYGGNETSSTKMSYGMKRLLAYQYTIEVDYANIIALAKDEKSMEELFAPGFLMKKQEFEEKFADKTVEDKDAKQYAKDFCEEVGPCFISRSYMGCNLDYYISIASSMAQDSTGVTGALDAKFSSAVTIKGNAEYTDDQKKKMQNTNAKATVKGGDVNIVSILATGGSLSNDSVLMWQQSVTPEKAVMVDMVLVPIYELFQNGAAKKALKEYVYSIAAIKQEN